MKRTHAEVKQQIEGLQAIAAKPTFRATTGFGDDNRAALEAQIEVLEQHLTEDDVCAKLDAEEYSEHVSNSARDAANWLAGDDDTTPVAGWDGLH